MPEFIVEVGSRVERRSFAAAAIRIGREAHCELVIDDARVSREHALVEFHEGQWLLRDLGSANGTFQDEVKIRRVILERGSRFAIADVAEITFLGDESREVAASVTTPAAVAGRPAAMPVPSAPMSAPSPAREPARRPVGDRPAPLVEGYEIVEPLGEGPASVAWLAHHRASATAEVLRAPTRQDALLEGAVLSWSRIDDPVIARLDVLRDLDGGLVMRERFAHQGTLDEKLGRSGKIEPAEGLELALRLGRGLATLHRNGVVMGCFRPARVRLYDDSEPRLAGPACLEVQAASCPEGALPGLRYLAPEHLLGEAPARRPTVASDLYSFGALLYRLVAGVEAVDGTTLDGIRRSVEKGPLKTPDERKNGLPEGLSDLIMSCLARDPRERPPALEEVLAALGEALERLRTRKRPDGQKLQARDKERGERVASAPKRSLQFRLASALVTLFLFALLNFVIYWFVFRGRF